MQEPQEPLCVFAFTDYRVFFREAMRRHPARRKPLSLAEWSNRLGYKSPRGVAMVLNGQRHPSGAMLETISRDLSLKERSHRYLELLVLKERVPESQREKILGELAELRRAMPQARAMTERMLRVFSEWFALPIKNLIAAPQFVEDYKWIAAKLRGKISVGDARLAIKALVDLGVARRDDAGRLRLSGTVPLFSGQDIPSDAVRAHHGAMLARAKEALEEQDVTGREFISMTIPFDADRLPEVKAFLRDVRDRFIAQFDKVGSDEVGQLNLQFFRHTIKNS